jgi:hypothetical protein
LKFFYQKNLLNYIMTQIMGNLYNIRIIKNRKIKFNESKKNFHNHSKKKKLIFEKIFFLYIYIFFFKENKVINFFAYKNSFI